MPSRSIQEIWKKDDRKEPDGGFKAIIRYIHNFTEIKLIMWRWVQSTELWDTILITDTLLSKVANLTCYGAYAWLARGRTLRWIWGISEKVQSRMTSWTHSLRYLYESVKRLGLWILHFRRWTTKTELSFPDLKICRIKKVDGSDVSFQSVVRISGPDCQA